MRTKSLAKPDWRNTSSQERDQWKSKTYVTVEIKKKKQNAVPGVLPGILPIKISVADVFGSTPDSKLVSYHQVWTELRLPVHSQHKWPCASPWEDGRSPAYRTLLLDTYFIPRVVVHLCFPSRKHHFPFPASFGPQDVSSGTKIKCSFKTQIEKGLAQVILKLSYLKKLKTQWAEKQNS